MSKRSPEANKRQNKNAAARKLKWAAEKRRAANPMLPPYQPRPATSGQVLDGSKANGVAGSPPVRLAPGQELKRQTIHVDKSGTLLDRYDLSQPERKDAIAPIVPPAHLVVKTTSHVDSTGRVDHQYVTSKPEEVAKWRAFWDACKSNAAEFAGLYAATPAPNLPASANDLLNAFVIGDPHIGMLAHILETGDNFDTKIAKRELLTCVRLLMQKAQPAKRCIIGVLGDTAHAQDDSARTPAHQNQLDVDGRWFKTLDAIHLICRAMVEMALESHEHVTFRNLPGNHDPRLAVELMYWLRAVYENEPRVTVADAYAAHQYDHFGTTLIGWHHGDRSKKGELPAIMAADHDGGGTGLWGQTDEHIWMVGHEHHTTVLETPSCFVWVHNTLAARDAYHAGRYRAKRMLGVWTFHRDFGLDGVDYVSLKRVRAALKLQAQAGA